MTDKNVLIQSYIDQTITAEQLREFQELLKNDPTVRRDLLLYSRLDIVIRDYVLFHDYMDDPGTRDRDDARESGLGQNRTGTEMLGRLLRNTFSGGNPETAF